MARTRRHFRAHAAFVGLRDLADPTTSLLHMPQDHLRGVSRTQLVVWPQPQGDMTPDELHRTLAHCEWVIQQFQPGLEPADPPLLLTLPLGRLQPDGDLAYITQPILQDVTALLHGKLDYARPFTLTLACHAPDARLLLATEFHLLGKFGRARRKQGDKRG